MLNVGNNKSTDEFDYANRIGCRSTERSRKVKQQPGKVKIERTSVPGRVSGSTDFVVLLKRGLKEGRSSRQ